MDAYKQLKLEYDGIKHIIESYSSGIALDFVAGLERAMTDDDREAVLYYLNQLCKWYDDNLESIRTNEFVYNYDEHFRNYNLLFELNKGIQIENENIEDKLNGCSVLAIEKSNCAEKNEEIMHFNRRDLKNTDNRSKSIFISHRTSNAEVADMLIDFLVGTGVSIEDVFCSSIKGNDVREKISPEVKMHLKECKVLILILSEEYYESYYCMNEAGIAWFLEDELTTIAVCLPEINENNMLGFFNGDNKIRRLDDSGDIAAIYDEVSETLGLKQMSHSVITQATTKLLERFNKYIKSRDLDCGENDSLEYILLLAYAASGESITVFDMDNASLIFGSNCGAFNSGNSEKETMRFLLTLEELVEKGYLKKTDNNHYSVTTKGLNKGESFISKYNIDTNNKAIMEIEKISSFEKKSKE